MQTLSSALQAALIDIDARVTPRVLVDLFDVLPPLPSNSLLRRCNGYVVLTRDLFQRHFTSHIFLSHGRHGFGAQFCVVAGLAFRLRVIRRRACFKMVRSHTSRIVTLVTNKCLLRFNCSIGQFVSYAMGRAARAIPSDLSIPRWREVPIPQPTMSRLINSRPKVFGRLHVSNEAWVRTILSGVALSLGIAWFYGKRGSAIFAGTQRATYSWDSHDLNLTDRFGLWSGPFAALNSLRAVSILAREAISCSN